MKKILIECVSVCLLSCGCVYKGAKVIEGTDLSVGLNVPSTDGAIDLSVLNYLSGFRLAVAENAAMTLEYSVSETNDFFGAVTTRTEKKISATLDPRQVKAQAE